RSAMTGTAASGTSEISAAWRTALPDTAAITGKKERSRAETKPLSLALSPLLRRGEREPVAAAARCETLRVNAARLGADSATPRTNILRLARNGSQDWASGFAIFPEIR